MCNTGQQINCVESVVEDLSVAIDLHANKKYLHARTQKCGSPQLGQLLKKYVCFQHFKIYHHQASGERVYLKFQQDDPSKSLNNMKYRETFLDLSQYFWLTVSFIKWRLGMAAEPHSLFTLAPFKLEMETSVEAPFLFRGVTFECLQAM